MQKEHKINSKGLPLKRVVIISCLLAIFMVAGGCNQGMASINLPGNDATDGLITPSTDAGKQGMEDTDTSHGMNEEDMQTEGGGTRAPGEKNAGDLTDPGKNNEENDAENDSAIGGKNGIEGSQGTGMGKDSDKKGAYTERELELIKEAQTLYSEGDYEKVDRLYSQLSTIEGAWQDDPIFLLNWGSTLLNLGSIKKALPKIEEALIKVRGRNELNDDIRDALILLVDKIPDANSLNSDEIQRIFTIIDNTEKMFVTTDAGVEKIADVYIGFASTFLKSKDAYSYIDSIKNCMDKAGRDINTKDSPFFLYIRGLMNQYENNMEEAVCYMRLAQEKAKNNRDIELWIKAYCPKDAKTGEPLREITMGNLKLKYDGFDILTGTKWIDDTRILTTAYVAEGESKSYHLLAINTENLAYKEIYKDRWFQLKFVTPNGKHAILWDNGLKLVDLESGKVTQISEAGSQCSLSPDGNKLAYIQQGVWIYNISQKTKKKINTGANDASPIWFPDSKNILFIGDIVGQAGAGNSNAFTTIFKMPVENPQEKTAVAPEWRGSFEFLDWIAPGEIVHVMEKLNYGDKSHILDIYAEDIRLIGNMHAGDTLIYKPGSYITFLLDGKGSVTRMDEVGRMIARYEFGDVWGDSFGVSLSQMQILSSSGEIMFFYGPTMTEKLSLWLANKDFDNLAFIAEVSGDYKGPLILSPNESKVMFTSGESRLVIYSLE